NCFRFRHSLVGCRLDCVLALQGRGGDERTEHCNTYWAIFHNRFPPTLESRTNAAAVSDSGYNTKNAQLSFLFLRRSFFASALYRESAAIDRRYRATRMRWIGQIFWLLA